MNKIKQNLIIKILFCTFLIIFISSCSGGKDKNITNQETTNNSNNQEVNNNFEKEELEITKAPEIEYDENGINTLKKGGKIGSDIVLQDEEKKDIKTITGGGLLIGDDVIIKKGRSKDFPSDFPIIKGGEIYNNSNMKEYGFIIVGNTTLSNIEIYYKEQLQEKGWFYIIDQEKEDDSEELNDDSQNLYLKFKKEIGENQFKNLNLSIKEGIPEIIKDNLKVEGMFIEVSFN